MEGQEDKIKRIYCDICNVPLGDEKTRQSHILGKKHQLALHHSVIDDIKVKSSVFIVGFPNQVSKENLNTFLSSFGTIKDIHIGDKNKFVIVQYTNEEVAQELLQSHLTYMGRNLYVKPRKLKETQKHVKIEGTQPDFDQLIESLKSLEPFPLQFKKMLDFVKSEDQNKEHKYEQVCADLRNALYDIFSVCSVYPFGSTITGLDFIGSDVDVYVEAKPRYPERENYTDEARAIAYVKKSCNVLTKNKNFSHCFAIPKAKTPICKCLHISTKINCDFNFKNMLGVCNSYLIRHYLDVDPKVREAMIIFKCWGKIHDLIGNQGKFSPYTLTILFIFYLQHRPCLLPPIHFLQRDCKYDNIQQNWNGGFDATTTILNDVIRNSSVQTLLYGFFSFYSKFDYNLNVICPYLSWAIPKIDFLETINLPDNYFSRYKNNVINIKMEPLRVETPICIQDPFEQNHNISKAVTNKTLEEFVGLCKQGMVVFDPSIKSPSLYRLFTEYTEERKMLSIKSDKTCIFKFPMGSSLTYLHSLAVGEGAVKKLSLQKAWFETITEYILSVLKDVLKVKLTIRDTSNKAIKLNRQTDVHDKIDSVSYNCTCKQNVWESRRSITKDLPFEHKESQTHLEKEIAVTNYICDVLCKGITMDTVILNFNITLTAVGSPTFMECTIEKNAAEKGYFNSFSNFFANRIPHWVDLFEKQKNNEIKGIINVSNTSLEKTSPVEETVT